MKRRASERPCDFLRVIQSVEEGFKPRTFYSWASSLSLAKLPDSPHSTLCWLSADLTPSPAPILSCDLLGSRITIRLLSGFPWALAYCRGWDFLLANVNLLLAWALSPNLISVKPLTQKAVADATCVRNSPAVRKIHSWVLVAGMWFPWYSGLLWLKRKAFECQWSLFLKDQSNQHKSCPSQILHKTGDFSLHSLTPVLSSSLCWV